jgi:CubicO group peptidase (beta-lactamase class C family)
MAEWKVEYKDRCGVDLRAVLNWAGGPPSQAPLNDHQEQHLYLGYGNSKPSDENHPVTNATICDNKQCVSLNAVSRSIYKQLACNVVGYAFFAGDRTSGPHAVFSAFGKSRTSLNPPETDFTATTKMQIASASKVLTALTGMRVFGSKMDGLAFKNFPSNWTLPQNTIVKNITFREFLSHTSGVQEYNASNTGQDFNSLRTFFTQTLSNPNAPRTCPGSGPPRVIPNPIVMQKTPACYSNTNFGLMRLVLPGFAGAATNDPAQLAQTYVQQVQANVFTPVGVSNVACKPPAVAANYALLYKYP